MGFGKIIAAENKTFGGKIDINQNKKSIDSIIFDKVQNSILDFNIQGSEIGVDFSGLIDGASSISLVDTTILQDGRVFVTYKKSSSLWYAIYAPFTDSWATAANMSVNPIKVSITTMGDGNVFIAYMLTTGSFYYRIYNTIGNSLGSATQVTLTELASIGVTTALDGSVTIFVVSTLGDAYTWYYYTYSTILSASTSLLVEGSMDSTIDIYKVLTLTNGSYYITGVFVNASYNSYNFTCSQNFSGSAFGYINYGSSTADHYARDIVEVRENNVLGLYLDYTDSPGPGGYIFTISSIFGYIQFGDSYSSPPFSGSAKASLLIDGRVILFVTDSANASSESYFIYDPETNTVTDTVSLGIGNGSTFYQPQTLDDGKIFLPYVDGSESSRLEYLIFSPETRLFVDCKNNTYQGFENGLIIYGNGDLP